MQQGGEALERVIERVNSQYPDADVSIVRKAAEYAMAMHEGQMRSSGDPYITHPLEVVNILLDLEVDIPTIAAALLHDVVEDTEATYEDIQREFSTEIAELVDGVTKLTRMSCNSREEQQAESLRKMMLATARDVRVIMIKLCDRLHNMRTLQVRPQDRQQAKAK